MLKRLFYLQRGDRQALVALLLLVVVLVSLVYFVGNGYEHTEAMADSTRQDSAGQHSAGKQARHTASYYQPDQRPLHLSPFDPNTADSTQLLTLGLSTWQVRSIYRYRAKGGVYRTPNDLARLYGMTKKQFETLRPYIRIADDYRPAADFYKSDYHYGERQARYTQGENKLTAQSEAQRRDTADKQTAYNYPHKIKPGQHIAINTADTTELQRIPGIGRYYAQKIVRYRDRLGGFVSKRQLEEELGDVPPDTYAYMEIDAAKVKRLNINKLTLKQLSRHPYINFYQAKAICDYRRTHGPIKSLQELHLLDDFPPAAIERLLPYVEY